MAAHINRLKEITTPGNTISENDAQEFISIITREYPNGDLKRAPHEVQLIIDAFEKSLSQSVELWAGTKLSQLKRFKETRNTFSAAIEGDRFKGRVTNLQQRLVQDKFAPESTNPIDGVAGPTTRKAILSYMTLEQEMFLNMINDMYGSSLSLEHDADMLKAMRILHENTGIKITQAELANFALHERAHAERTEYQVWKSKTLQENLEEYSTFPDTVEWRAKQQKLLLVITNKLQKENIIVIFDATANTWKLQNNDGTPNNAYALTQDQLQFIAISGTISTTWSIESVSTAPDIPQVFGSVVKKFEFNRPDGTPWTHYDMEDDPSWHITGKQVNRDAFVAQVSWKITDLEAMNKLDTTQPHTKKDNTVWLQRLHLLKGQFTSPDAIDRNVMTQVATVASGSTLNNYLADNPETRPVDLIDRLISGQAVDDILQSGIVGPAIIVWIVGMFIALPKWLKYPTYGVIGALILNGPYKNLVKKWWLDEHIRAAFPQGTSTPAVGVRPGTAPSTNAFQKFISGVPGVNSQFNHWLAVVHQEYLAHDGGRWRERFPEANLELITSLTSQDSAFLSKTAADVEAWRSNPKSLFSPSTHDLLIAKGITENEMSLYISFLLKAKQSNDTNVSDILSDGKFEASNPIIPSYVEWEDDFNKEISELVKNLEGFDKDTSWLSESEKGTKWRVQTILAVTLPNIFMYQNTDSAELNNIIIELEKVSTDPKTSTTDKWLVDQIILKYKEIQESLKWVETVAAWEREAGGITNPRGTETLKDIYNWLSDGLAWATGVPVSILGKIDKITPPQIEEVIQKWEVLKVTYAGSPELLKKIEQELFELQNRKAFLLASLAMWTNDPTARTNLVQQWRAALRESIAMKPEVFEEQVASLTEKIAKLKAPQTNVEWYYEILRGSARSIRSLTDIVAAGDVNGKARIALDEALGAYRTNLESYANRTTLWTTSRLGKLAAILNRTDLTAADLQSAQAEYTSLRSELLSEWLMMQARSYLYENGIINNWQKEEYTDLLAIIQKWLSPIMSVRLFDSDLKTKFDELETLLQDRGIEVSVSIDADTIATRAPLPTGPATVAGTTAFITWVAAVQDDISRLLEPWKEGAQDRLNKHVSAYIEKLAEQAKWASSPEDLDKVIVLYEKLDGIARAEDNFDEVVEEKKESEVEVKLLDKLKDTTLWELEWGPIDSKIEAYFVETFKYTEIVDLVTKDAGLTIVAWEISDSTTLYQLLEVISAIATIPSLTISWVAVPPVEVQKVHEDAKSTVTSITNLLAGESLEVGKYKVENLAKHIEDIVKRLFI